MVHATVPISNSFTCLSRIFQIFDILVPFGARSWGGRFVVSRHPCCGSESPARGLALAGQTVPLRSGTWQGGPRYCSLSCQKHVVVTYVRCHLHARLVFTRATYTEFGVTNFQGPLSETRLRDELRSRASGESHGINRHPSNGVRGHDSPGGPERLCKPTSCDREFWLNIPKRLPGVVWIR